MGWAVRVQNRHGDYAIGCSNAGRLVDDHAQMTAIDANQVRGSGTGAITSNPLDGRRGVIVLVCDVQDASPPRNPLDTRL